MKQMSSTQFCKLPAATQLRMIKSGVAKASYFLELTEEQQEKLLEAGFEPSQMDEEEETEEEETEEEEQPEPEPEPEPQPKRGRGRPKKNKTEPKKDDAPKTDGFSADQLVAALKGLVFEVRIK